MSPILSLYCCHSKTSNHFQQIMRVHCKRARAHNFNEIAPRSLLLSRNLNSTALKLVKSNTFAHNRTFKNYSVGALELDTRMTTKLRHFTSICRIVAPSVRSRRRILSNRKNFKLTYRLDIHISKKEQGKLAFINNTYNLPSFFVARFGRTSTVHTGVTERGERRAEQHGR